MKPQMPRTLSWRRAAVTFGLACLFLTAVTAQQSGLTAAQIKTAETEVPRLVELLALEPGMTIADVGAGFGAWTMTFSRWTGATGRVFATDVGPSQLTALREMVKREGLANVTVIEGAAAGTNLPPMCCDAILIRDAYHHFTQPEDMVRSIAASLKPGGRLAIIDFPPGSNTSLPAGVPADRGGHGVPPEVIQREVGALLKHVRTIADWGPRQQAPLFLVLFQKP